MTRRTILRPSPALEALRSLVRDNIPARLGPYLRNLARASVMVGSVAVGSAAATGCTSSHINFEEFSPPTCADGSLRALTGIAAPSHDFLGAYTSVGGGLPGGYLADSVGDACAGASDAASCNAEVRRLTQETYGTYFLTTDGDDARVHQTPDEIRALFGEIDTADEALLVAWQAGYTLTCDDLERAGVREIEGGYEVIATRTAGGCGAPVVISRYVLFVGSDATVTELSIEEIERREDWGCEGRRPEGLQPVTSDVPEHPVGRWFASMARLEQSAVDAFEGVADELQAHGAPASLVDASRVAAQDEVRHHQAMSRLARRFGAQPLPAEIVPHPVRPLYDIALENAVEGCIRETYGALAAHRQAFAAEDAEVAAAMAEIAEDESRHAALSWQIAAWIEPRLTDDERAELQIAKSRAFTDLRAEAHTSPNAELVRLAGVPDATTALALLDHLADTIFA